MAFWDLGDLNICWSGLGVASAAGRLAVRYRLSYVWRPGFLVYVLRVSGFSVNEMIDRRTSNA
jgi:hypothetical protein